MQLMTKELARQLPALYKQDGKGVQAIVYAHLFTSSSDWYITEYDGSDTAFCYCCLNGDLDNAELGYASLNELAGVKIAARVNGRIVGHTQAVERDLHWTPKTLREVKDALRERHMPACIKGCGRPMAGHDPYGDMCAACASMPENIPDLDHGKPCPICKRTGPCQPWPLLRDGTEPTQADIDEGGYGMPACYLALLKAQQGPSSVARVPAYPNGTGEPLTVTGDAGCDFLDPFDGM